MGVSGCGKTSVGLGLSEVLGWPFYDGDDFHPQANIDKMARGIALDDNDRLPWLERLHALIREHLEGDRSLLVACSALKANYRDVLKGGREEILFVHLEGSFELVYSRMENRSGHYMKADMLQSQYRDLEPPADALTTQIDQPVDAIITEIIGKLESGSA
ncbi:MAG TPA: gluconokinase [candidate division Zixibacteria bacterium]|nr:gluconokinase [candidate division Zixibacteria bacterium]